MRRVNGALRDKRALFYIAEIWNVFGVNGPEKARSNCSGLCCACLLKSLTLSTP